MWVDTKYTQKGGWRIDTLTGFLPFLLRGANISDDTKVFDIDMGMDGEDTSYVLKYVLLLSSNESARSSS